jgi:hypothetical protein
MPLFIDRTGPIANWLDGKNATHYLQTGVLKPSAVPLLAAKVQSENRWKLLSTSNAKVLETLNLFVGSGAAEADRIAAGRKVHYKNIEPYPSTWGDLANFILHEIVTNSNRVREIEMAMIIAKSPVIMGTVNATILSVEKLMTAVRLSRGASLTTKGDKPDFDEGKLRATSNVTKFYLPWTQNKSVQAALGDSAAGFTTRVALLHDLMEFSVMMFASGEVRKVLGVARTPMNHAETVTTADGVQARDGGTEPKSIQYAKSLHCPVECGPSYTTTRLLRLPTAISVLTSNALAEEAAPAEPAPRPGARPAAKTLPDPMKRMAGVRVVPHAPGYIHLSPAQRGHIAWAIFGWWTLNFPKHWGNGAHCFFAVSDAARSCGADIVPNPGAYPSREELCTLMQVRWTASDTTELERRKQALLAGNEQSTAA